VNKFGWQLKDSLIVAVSKMQMARGENYSNKFDEAVPLFEESLQHYLANILQIFGLAYNDLDILGTKRQLSKQADCLVRSVSIYENYFLLIWRDRHCIEQSFLIVLQS